MSKIEKQPDIEDKKLSQSYSSEQLAAYQLELDALLERIEFAVTHYDVLGVDYLATTGEIKLAYMKATALLNPTLYNLNLPQPDDLLLRIDAAFEKLSGAFSVLVNFTRRAQYDDLLFEREGISSDMPAEKTLSSQVVQVIESSAEEENEEDGQIERRQHQRFELTLPVRVTGYHPANGTWQEMTQTSDVSVSGVLIKLSMPVRKGMILHLSMPMPITLRNHRFFEDTYECYAIVRRIAQYQDDTDLIGLEFIGENPPAAYSEKPWGIFQTEAPKDTERRRAKRKKVVKKIRIEYLDSDLNVLAKEDATTIDVSREGMSVRVKNAPSEIFMIKIESLKGNFEGYADVVNRLGGTDGSERLCLTFLSQTV